MAQLFTVYFPKYCFEIQDEFDIEFDDASKLPFDPDVTHKGIPFVKDINYRPNENIFTNEDIKKWTEEGLKVGLRITQIGDKQLGEDKVDGSFVSVDGKPFTKNELLLQIRNKGKNSIKFHFREDIYSVDESDPLGLTYIPSQTLTSDDIKQEEQSSPNLYNDLEDENKANISSKQQRQRPISQISQKSLHSQQSSHVISYKINDSDISVSSFDETHPPNHVRLNHPESYWSPSTQNEQSRDVWICFDLGTKKSVDKIQVQGSQDHMHYVQELWVEFSDDLCHWESHPMRNIKCHYIAGKKGLSELDLDTDDEDDAVNGSMAKMPDPMELKQDSTVVPDYTLLGNDTEYDMATIKLWPVIHAQFIRIRPWKWREHVAMRVELWGFDQVTDVPQVGKVVTVENVESKYKTQLMEELVGKDMATKFIQIDCEAIIKKAMQLARCTSYGILNTKDTDHLLLVFSTPNAALSEAVLDSLMDVGVGSQIGLITASSLEWRTAAANVEQHAHLMHDEEKKSNGFYHTIRSHKVLKVVVERIFNSADLTFDYFCMLTIASLIAVGGLATDSSVVVVASMLVSPIMGPVMAYTFGVTLKQWSLVRMGALNETFSLFMCVFYGAVVGWFWAWCTENRNNWPTEQMVSRGETWYVLADGAYIAAASGVGVALSVLGEYMSTVIGVAISASLLPPAVNAGMLLTFSIYAYWKPMHYHADYDIQQLLMMALVSFILTVENIFIIFLTGLMMFRIKDAWRMKDQNQEKVWDAISKFKHSHLTTSMKKAYGSRDLIDRPKTMAIIPGPSSLVSPSLISPDVHGGVNGETEMTALSKIQSYDTHHLHPHQQWQGNNANKAWDDINRRMEASEQNVLYSSMRGGLYRALSTFNNDRSTTTSSGDIYRSARGRPKALRSSTVEPNIVIQKKQKHKKSQKKAGFQSVPTHPDDEMDEHYTSAEDTLPQSSIPKVRPQLSQIFSQQVKD